MGKSKEPEEIKVTDRRHSATKESASDVKKGESFVAQDKPGEADALEQVDFSTLVFSFATSALINLGIAPDPATNKTEKNLGVAKQNIDILGVLKEKTRGNLSKDEEHLLESLLTEVRMRFVEITK